MIDSETSFPLELDDELLERSKRELWQMRYEGDTLQIPFVDENGRMYWKAANSVSSKDPKGDTEGSTTSISLVDEQNGDLVDAQRITAEVLVAANFFTERLVWAINNAISTRNGFAPVVYGTQDAIKNALNTGGSDSHGLSNPQDGGKAQSFRFEKRAGEDFTVDDIIRAVQAVA